MVSLQLQQTLEQERLTKTELASRTKTDGVRYLTDGAVIGSKAFVYEVFVAARGTFPGEAQGRSAEVVGQWQGGDRGALEYEGSEDAGVSGILHPCQSPKKFRAIIVM